LLHLLARLADQPDKPPKRAVMSMERPKKEADDAILGMKNKLKTTIVRPGGLTDEDAARPQPTNHPNVGESIQYTDNENIVNSRADVARLDAMCRSLCR
jgi:hypothetical protein